jgi:hypothetical protein
MATPSWQVSGQYYETCSCDFVCPCLPGQMAVSPSKGSCTFAMAFQIDRGSYGSISLDGLGFIVLGLTSEAMGKGNNRSVGVIADERASAEQRDAITAIASGSGGGPMAALSGLVGRFLGVVSAPIRFRAKRHQMVRQGVDPGRYGSRGRQGARSQRCGADAPRPHGPSGGGSVRAGSRVEQPRARARPDVGRYKWTEQRTVRPIFLAKCVASLRSLHSHAATASSSRPRSFSLQLSLGPISFVSIDRCRRRWNTTR